MVPHADTALREHAPAPDDFLHDVLEGLRQPRKQIPCKYLYDARGAQLFEEICTLDEYYPTRTELGIMQTHAPEMARALGTDVALVELGSGSSLKTRVLLDHLEQPRVYVPVDISREHLQASAGAVNREYPLLRVEPVWADYTAAFSLPLEAMAGARRVVYFPGSTIGNFTRVEAQQFLRRIARLAGAGGGLLIGADLKKEQSVLLRAYDDVRGVTAAFNLNLLTRINQELDADFPVERFIHHAPYNEVEGRIEMHLLSLDTRHVRVAGEVFRFRSGEGIWTESSHKYSPGEFARLAGGAGLSVERFWTDPQRRFSVQYLRVNAS